jgi:hypothetical protein
MFTRKPVKIRIYVGNIVCVDLSFSFSLHYRRTYFDVELRLSPRWVEGNIGSTDATKTCHILNAYIFETNNRKLINNTSLDSLQSPIYKKASFNPQSLNPLIQWR